MSHDTDNDGQFGGANYRLPSSGSRIDEPRNLERIAVYQTNYRSILAGHGYEPTEERAAFLKLMEGKEYGQGPLLSAWAWFREGRESCTRSESGRVEGWCPDCKGAGTVKGMTHGRGPDDHEIDVDCPKCGGTGAGPIPEQPFLLSMVAYMEARRDGYKERGEVIFNGSLMAEELTEWIDRMKRHVPSAVRAIEPQNLTLARERDEALAQRDYWKRTAESLTPSASRAIPIDANMIANAHEAEKVGMTRVTMSVPVDVILGRADSPKRNG